MPPWIAVLAAELCFVSLVPFVLADYSGSSLAYAIVATAGCLGGLLLALRARVRAPADVDARLALTFGYIAAALGYLLLQLYSSAPDFYGGSTVRTARAVPWLPATALVAALTGLATVVLVRPADLLRWTPTGAAWDVYRPRLTATAAAEPDTPPSFVAGSSRLTDAVGRGRWPSGVRVRRTPALPPSPLLALAVRAAPLVGLATVVAGLLALQQVDAGTARLAAPAAFLVAAPVWLGLRGGSLRFRIPPSDRRTETLEPPRSRSTALWFFSFAVAWIGLLGAS